MIERAILFGLTSAISGYLLAHILDASIAGAIATMNGILFIIVFIAYLKK
jgi:manganese/zinc/iron transport system permease protein